MSSDWKIYDDKYVTIDGLKIRYWETGHGKEHLLFIHGFGGAVEEWIFNIPHFENKYHIYAIDLPGQGNSDKPTAPFSLEFCVNLIHSFLIKMKVESLTIIGHSLGGMVALLFSIKYMKMIDKIVLISPACIEHYGLMFRIATIPFVGEMLMKPPATYDQVRESLSGLTYRPFELPLEVIKKGFEVNHGPGYMKASLNYLRGFLNLFGVSKAGKTLLNYVRNNAKNITKPVLLFWGDKDAVLPIRYNGTIKTNLNNLQYQEFKDCGHNPHWERAKDFNRIVGEFLKK